MNFSRKTEILFRVDANSKIGLGHLVRCLALAEMLKECFVCKFAIQEPSALVESMIQKENFVINKLAKNLDNVLHFSEILPYLSGQEIVILDGYRFSSNYFKAVKEIGCKVVCIDDLSKEVYYADALINHAPFIKTQKYIVDPFTELLCGLNYALLRKEFLFEAKKQRTIKAITTAFICFGGSDFNNLTAKILKATCMIEEIQKINIVVGNAYLYSDDLSKAIKKYNNGKDINMYSNLSSTEMINIMCESQLAIIPASGICLETMCIGMPIVIGTYADNQKEMLDGCKELGTCFSIGDYNTEDINVMTRLIKLYITSRDWEEHIKNQKKVLTGNSKIKLLNFFEGLVKEDSISLRMANMQDLETYFSWVNDPEVRRNAIQTSVIIKEDHVNWFSHKLISPNSFLYFFEYDNLPLGQVRFDLKNNEYLMDYSVDMNFRSQGMGKLILRKAMKFLLASLPYSKVNFKALVKKSNIASKKVFESLNFLQNTDEIFDYYSFSKSIKYDRN